MPSYHESIEFWLKIIGVVGALIALTVTWRTHAERATFEMIDKLYAACHMLEANAIRDWYLAHLLCIGVEDYKATKSKIERDLKGNPDRCQEFLVKEKLFALHILTLYEQVYYQWKNSYPLVHQRRRRFLEDMLSYFTGRLLQNPRLVWFLRNDVGGAGLHLEAESKLFVDRVIDSAPTRCWADDEGPFVLSQPVVASSSVAEKRPVIL